jgi:hypothetical protein
MEIIKRNYPFLFYFNKALMVRGDPIGFKNMAALIQNRQLELSGSIQPFVKFGEIISKKVSPAVSKDNGYEAVSKVLHQRVFSTLFPVIFDAYSHCIA